MSIRPIANKILDESKVYTRNVRGEEVIDYKFSYNYLVNFVDCILQDLNLSTEQQRILENANNYDVDFSI